MRKLILILTALFTALPFFAQGKFTIRGRVVDALMRNELPGAQSNCCQAKTVRLFHPSLPTCKATTT